MGNILAAFQNGALPTYKSTDQFQNRLEGKQQGEQVDLSKGLSQEIPLGISWNLLYHHVCTFLSFIFFCSHTHLSSKKA